jgi:hypothetical protein
MSKSLDLEQTTKVVEQCEVHHSDRADEGMSHRVFAIRSTRHFQSINLEMSVSADPTQLCQPRDNLWI